MQQARSQQTQNPTVARQKYAQAAAAYRRAGDKAKAQAVLREAAAVAKAAAAAAKAASQTPQAAPSTTVAKLEPSGTTPSQTSGASQAPSAPPASAALPRHWEGTGDPADCAAANDLEKGTAAWYDMCVPDPPDDMAAWRAKFHFSHYEPPISPQILMARAIAECKSAHWDVKRKCIDDFKIKTLLADDDAVKKDCTNVSDPQKQLRCISAVYEFGPGTQWENSLREALAARLAAATNDSADTAEPKAIGSKAGSAETDKHDGCPPGQGVQPDRSAFGAWTCQPLLPIGTQLVPGTKDGDAKPDADPFSAFEDSVDGVAATVAAATVKASGVAEKERPACLTAAYKAARSLLKGGTAPKACGATPDAARAELLRFARGHVDTGNPGTEALLAYRGARDRGTAMPGASVSSLRDNPPSDHPPSDNQSARLTTCMLSGGETQACALATSARKPSAAACSEAGAHWKSTEEIKNLATYEDHLLRFPTCSFAGLASARIEALLKQ